MKAGFRIRPDFIHFSPPAVGGDEIEAVSEALRSGWITTGPRAEAFEHEFADFIGAESALALSSATDALRIALAASGIGPGDEVITTPMTFCSTVHVIEQSGARPVLADVQRDTLNIDPELVAVAISSRTRAIIPVHLYGHPCDMNELLSLAADNGLSVIEDAAHALPASYRGRTVGTIGDMTAFSFYATKNMTTGEGGMLTGSKKLIEAARKWSLHGIDRSPIQRYGSPNDNWSYQVVLPGYKCNMTDIQAAIGRCQLQRLKGFQRRRRRVAALYDEAFAGCEELETPTRREGVEPALHIYPLRLRDGRLRIGRERFIRELALRNVGASVHFIPVHLHPYYRDRYGFSPSDFPIAFDNFRRLVSLPLNPVISDEEARYVADSVKDIVDEFRV
jgi:dTDP-4-amino-4,6-dideoxygalactose transaminase